MCFKKSAWVGLNKINLIFNLVFIDIDIPTLRISALSIEVCAVSALGETSFCKREESHFSRCPSLEPHSSLQVDSHDCFVCVTWTIPVVLFDSVRVTRENTDGRIMKMTPAATTTPGDTHRQWLCDRREEHARWTDRTERRLENDRDEDWVERTRQNEIIYVTYTARPLLWSSLD